MSELNLTFVRLPRLNRSNLKFFIKSEINAETWPQEKHPRGKKTIISAAEIKRKYNPRNWVESKIAPELASFIEFD